MTQKFFNNLPVRDLPLIVPPNIYAGYKYVLVPTCTRNYVEQTTDAHRLRISQPEADQSFFRFVSKFEAWPNNP